MTANKESGRALMHSDFMLHGNCHVSLAQSSPKAIRRCSSLQSVKKLKAPSDSDGVSRALKMGSVTAQSKRRILEDLADLKKDSDAPPAVRHCVLFGKNKEGTAFHNYKCENDGEKKHLNSRALAIGSPASCEPATRFYSCSNRVNKAGVRCVPCHEGVEITSSFVEDAERYASGDDQSMQRGFSCSPSESQSMLPIFSRVPSLPSFQHFSVSPRRTQVRRQTVGFSLFDNTVNMRRCRSLCSPLAQGLLFDTQSSCNGDCAAHIGQKGFRGSCGNFTNDVAAAAASVVAPRERHSPKYILKHVGRTSSFSFALSYPSAVVDGRLKTGEEEEEKELFEWDGKMRRRSAHARTEGDDVSNKNERARVTLFQVDKTHISRNLKAHKSESFLSLSTPKRLSISQVVSFSTSNQTLLRSFSRTPRAQKEHHHHHHHHHHLHQHSCVFSHSQASSKSTPRTPADCAGRGACVNLQRDVFARFSPGLRRHSMEKVSLPMLLSGAASEKSGDVVVNLPPAPHCTKVDDNVDSASSILLTCTTSNVDTQWTSCDPPLDALVESSCFATSISAASAK